MSESLLWPVYYRILNRITGAVVIQDLAHLHQSTWTVKGMQPGAPGGSAIGSFTIPLFSPQSEQFKANWSDYKQLLPGLAEGLRVEGYMGAIAGAPRYAGVITDVTIDSAGAFTLSGQSDVWIASRQKPFPGEVFTNDGGGANSLSRARLYVGENIVALTDQFNPYTSGNYTSTNLPALTAGTWSGTTDGNGINTNVVTNSTGTGAVLINKTGTAATGDTDGNQFVECVMRFNATSSTNTTNAGRAGVGISSSNANANDLIVAYATIKFNVTSGRYDVDASIRTYAGGVLGTNVSAANVLTSVDDADGWISLQLQLLTNGYQTAFSINGTVALASTGTSYFTLGGATGYPLLLYVIPTTGTSPGYFTNLIQGVRNADSALHTTAPFITGATDSPAHSISWLLPLPPTFLDIWSLVATLETWSWRYTPVAMAAGTHPTMGTVDFQVTPGTDRSSSITFTEGRNLVSLTQQANADTFAADSRYGGAASIDGSGVASSRNIPAMNAYGWLSDNDMSLTATGWSQLQRQGGQVIANKGAPGSSYTAKVMRDADTADQWRELDYVTVHCPSIGVYNQKLLVLAYTFTEGSAEQQVTLGQYGADDVGAMVGLTRLFQGLKVMAGTFKAR